MNPNTSNTRKRSPNFLLTMGLVTLTALCFTIIAGCNSATTTQSDQPAKTSKRIVVVSYPFQFLTEQIAGPDYTIDFPVPEGEDPRTWQPSVTDINTIQTADLVIAGGPGIIYAEWLDQISLARSKIVETSNALAISDFIHIKDYEITHSHGPGGEHSHPLMIPYSWLDPAIAKKQCGAISKALAKRYPADAETFQSNLRELSKKLDDLSAKLKAVGNGKETSIVSTNPNLKFLSRAAGIRDVHLTWFEPASDGAQRDVRQNELDELVTKEKPSAILGLPGDGLGELSTTLPNTTFDTMDAAPAEGNYLSSLAKQIEDLAALLNQPN